MFHVPSVWGCRGCTPPRLTFTVSPLPLTDAGLVVKRHGNATHNTVCQCRAGMHCSDASCQTCVENEPCKQGFGFVAGETQPVPIPAMGPMCWRHRPQVLPGMEASSAWSSTRAL